MLWLYLINAGGKSWRCKASGLTSGEAIVRIVTAWYLMHDRNKVEAPVVMDVKYIDCLGPATREEMSITPM